MSLIVADSWRLWWVLHRRDDPLDVDRLYNLTVRLLGPGVGWWPLEFDPGDLAAYHRAALADGADADELTLAHLTQIRAGRVARILGLARTNPADEVDPP